MRISDWSSDVCSSDLHHRTAPGVRGLCRRPPRTRRLQAREGHRQWPDRRNAGGGQRGIAPRGNETALPPGSQGRERSEEHTSELQSLMRLSYAVFCLKKKTITSNNQIHTTKRQQKSKRYYQTN